MLLPPALIDRKTLFVSLFLAVVIGVEGNLDAIAQNGMLYAAKAFQNPAHAAIPSRARTLA